MFISFGTQLLKVKFPTRTRLSHAEDRKFFHMECNDYCNKTPLFCQTATGNLNGDVNPRLCVACLSSDLEFILMLHCAHLSECSYRTSGSCWLSCSPDLRWRSFLFIIGAARIFFCSLCSSENLWAYMAIPWKHAYMLQFVQTKGICTQLNVHRRQKKIHLQHFMKTLLHSLKCRKTDQASRQDS